MATEQIEGKFPKRSLVYLLICVVGVAAFVVIGILPAQRSLDKLEEEIAKVRAEIERKKILSPVFTELLGKVRSKEKTILPFPSPSPLPEEATGRLSMMFGEMARKCDLEANSVLPDFKSLGGDSGTLGVDILLKGGFFNFRKFLLLLGEQPYLKHIEEIQVREIPGGRKFRLKLRLLVS